jgi:hypothetical protein
MPLLSGQADELKISSFELGRAFPSPGSCIHRLLTIISRTAMTNDLLVLTLFKLLLPLLLPLPLELPDLLGRAVLDQIAAVAQPTPLGQTIRDIHDALAVEHVAARLEEGLVLVRLEVDERGEQQDHVAALVHDGRVAEGAAHFAGQLVLDGFFRRVVPLEVVVAVGEVDVLLVEDGGPLEGSGCTACVSCSLMERMDCAYRVVSGRWCNGTACCRAAPFC